MVSTGLLFTFSEELVKRDSVCVSITRIVWVEIQSGYISSTHIDDDDDVDNDDIDTLDNIRLETATSTTNTHTVTVTVVHTDCIDFKSERDPKAVRSKT